MICSLQSAVKSCINSPIVLACIASFFAAALNYLNTLPAGFAFDDSFAIIHNHDVTGSNPISNVWKHDFWGQDLKSDKSHKSYRPLTTLSFRLIHWIWSARIPSSWRQTVKGWRAGLASTDGMVSHDDVSLLSQHDLDPLPFHVANILLHAVVSALVCRLAYYLFEVRFKFKSPVHQKHTAFHIETGKLGDPPDHHNDPGSGPESSWERLVCVHAPAWLSGLLFAVHPVHTEAVSGIVGHAELLCACFGILAMLAYFKATSYDNLAQPREAAPLETATIDASRSAIDDRNSRRSTVADAGHICGCSSVRAGVIIQQGVWVLLSAALTVAAALCKEIGITFVACMLGFDVLLVPLAVSSQQAMSSQPVQHDVDDQFASRLAGKQGPVTDADATQHVPTAVQKVEQSNLRKRHAAQTEDSKQQGKHPVTTSPNAAVSKHDNSKTGKDTALGSRSSAIGDAKRRLLAFVIHQKWWRMLAMSAVVLVYVKARSWLAGDQLVRIYRKVENPIPFLPSTQLRVLNTAHLHARYAWLLLWPQSLSADWSFQCIHVVQGWSDARNLGSVALYGYLLYTVLSAAPWRIVQEWCRMAATKTPSSTHHHATGVSGCSSFTAASWRLVVAAGLLVGPFFPASNVLFYVGTFIGERLLYTPSIGGILLVCELLFTCVAHSLIKQAVAALNRNTSPNTSQADSTTAGTSSVSLPGSGSGSSSSDSSSSRAVPGDGGSTNVRKGVCMELRNKKEEEEEEEETVQIKRINRCEDGGHRLTKDDVHSRHVVDQNVKENKDATKTTTQRSTDTSQPVRAMRNAGGERSSNEPGSQADYVTGVGLQAGQIAGVALRMLCVLTVCCAVLLALGLGARRTWQRNWDWLSEETLFVAAQKVCPNSAKVQLNSGILARRHGAYDTAIDHFQRAQDIEPGYCEPTYWIGATYANQGNIQRSVEKLEQALTCKYVASQALNGLQKVYQTFHSAAPEDGRPLARWGGILAGLPERLATHFGSVRATARAGPRATPTTNTDGAPYVMESVAEVLGDAEAAVKYIVEGCEYLETAALTMLTNTPPMTPPSSTASSPLQHRSVEALAGLNTCLSAITDWETRYSALPTALASLQQCINARGDIYHQIARHGMASKHAKKVLYVYLDLVHHRHPECRLNPEQLMSFASLARSSSHPGTVLSMTQAEQLLALVPRTPQPPSHMQLMHKFQSIDPEDPWLQREWAAIMDLQPDRHQDSMLHFSVAASLLIQAAQNDKPKVIVLHGKKLTAPEVMTAAGSAYASAAGVAARSHAARTARGVGTVNEQGARSRSEQDSMLPVMFCDFMIKSIEAHLAALERLAALGDTSTQSKIRAALTEVLSRDVLNGDIQLHRFLSSKDEAVLSHARCKEVQQAVMFVKQRLKHT